MAIHVAGRELTSVKKAHAGRFFYLIYMVSTIDDCFNNSFGVPATTNTHAHTEEARTTSLLTSPAH